MLLPNLNTCGISCENPTHSKSSTWVFKGKQIFMLPVMRCMSFPWTDRKIPTYFCFRGVFVPRCDHGMVTERDEDTPSAMLCVSVSLRKPSERASILHRADPGEIHVRLLWNTGPMTDMSPYRGSVDAREAEALEMNAGCSCDARCCTAARNWRRAARKAQIRCPLTYSSYNIITSLCPSFRALKNI